MKLTQSTTTNADFKSVLIYGETQSGKTSLLGALARAYHSRTGKKTRLILCDEGGPSAIQPEINDGIIEVVDMMGDSQPQSNLMWLAKGHFIGDSGSIDQKKQNLEGIGIVALDSISSAADLVINQLVQSGTKISQDVVALREEQGLKFGNPSQSHYGAVQRYMLQLISALNGLPVDHVFYTALESKGQDATDGSVTLGPLVSGKALTSQVPSRMNRILHLEIVPTQDKKSRVYRIYFRPHIDSVLFRPWPANLRLPLKLQKQLEGHPEYGKGYIDFSTGDELLALFEYCDGLMGEKKEEVSVSAQSQATKPATPTISSTITKPVVISTGVLNPITNKK